MTVDVNRPTEAFLRGIDIHTLLPQQEPFVMIGALVGFDEALTRTETTIAPTNLLVGGGALSTSGMMENIAQTCAARIGYYNKYILGRGIQIGVIAAVRDMRVLRHPAVGETIVTETTVMEQVMGMTLARATVAAGGELLATARIKLAVREGEEQA